MNTHLAKIKNHTVFDYVVKAKTAILEISSTDNLSLDFLRMNLILENFEQAVNSTDTNLISDSWLTEAQVGVKAISDNLLNYNAQQAHIKNARLVAANRSIDNILSATVKINSIKSGQSVDRHALENHTALINTILVDFKKELDDAKKFVTELPDFKKNLTASLDQKVDEMETLFDGAKTELTKLLNEYQKELEDARDSYSKDSSQFNTFLSDAEQSHEKKLVEIEQARKTSFNEMLDAYKIEYNDLVKKTYEVFKNAGKLAFTDDYKEAAKTAKASMERWNRWVIGSIFTIAILTTTFFLLSSDFSWLNFGSKTLVTTSIAVLTFHASRQVARYAQIERHAQRTALELSTLDSFISNLPKKQQDEIKCQVTTQLFGNINPSESDLDKKILKTLDGKFENLLNLLIAVRGK